MLETIYSQAVTAFAVIVVLFVFLKGDEPERIAAATYGFIALAAAMIPGDTRHGGPMWGLMALNIVQLAVFIGLAWHSHRTWLVWASAFQAMIVTGHLMVALQLRPPANALAAMNNLANYALLIALAVGTFWAWQERRAANMGREGFQGRP